LQNNMIRGYVLLFFKYKKYTMPQENREGPAHLA
jgi:hypothetical protein